MKLGIGLPNTLGYELDRELFLEWARLADEAGFYVAGTIDKPNFDSWDPLVSVAAAATVTERILLATTILHLPNRNEVLVAKQAAVIDRVSGGRLVLGVAQGGRADDYEVFGAEFRGRSKRFERQVARIREVWATARESTRDEGVLGPAPLQNLPPIWAGANTPPAVQRAIRVGDGYLFGTAGAAWMTEAIPRLREAFAAAGKSDATIAGLAYVAVGDDPAKALEEAAHHVHRYYGPQLWAPVEDLIHHGPAEKIAEEVTAYDHGDLDVLILFPEIPDVRQVEQLAEFVLPGYPS
jgi:alkanesulfonate monooxygenase SsuD/methylene tetrahydromethanopterin reductase-like flavin-dependent oxidoreductase (luciferase family)